MILAKVGHPSCSELRSAGHSSLSPGRVGSGRLQASHDSIDDAAKALGDDPKTVRLISAPLPAITHENPLRLAK